MIPFQTHHQASADLHRLQMWLREHHPYGIVPPTGVSKKNSELCLTSGDTGKAAARSSLRASLCPSGCLLRQGLRMSVLLYRQYWPPPRTVHLTCLPHPQPAAFLLMRGRETLSHDVPSWENLLPPLCPFFSANPQLEKNCAMCGDLASSTSSLLLVCPPLHIRSVEKILEGYSGASEVTTGEDEKGGL